MKSPKKNQAIFSGKIRRKKIKKPIGVANLPLPLRIR